MNEKEKKSLYMHIHRSVERRHVDAFFFLDARVRHPAFGFFFLRGVDFFFEQTKAPMVPNIPFSSKSSTSRIQSSAKEEKKKRYSRNSERELKEGS